MYLKSTPSPLPLHNVNIVGSVCPLLYPHITGTQQMLQDIEGAYIFSTPGPTGPAQPLSQGWK